MYKFLLMHKNLQGRIIHLPGIFPSTASAIGFIHQTFGAGKAGAVNWDRYLKMKREDKSNGQPEK